VQIVVPAPNLPSNFQSASIFCLKVEGRTVKLKIRQETRNEVSNGLRKNIPSLSIHHFLLFW
jgi:hypothetical protein